MYQEIKKEIESFGFNVVSHDFERPWGGFLVVDECQVQDFSNKFFVTLSNYIFPKTKSVRDQFTIKQLKEIEKQGFMDRDPDPTK